jgi:MFS transporter, DHA3 family, macrolide efflux protein
MGFAFWLSWQPAILVQQTDQIVNRSQRALWLENRDFRFYLSAISIDAVGSGMQFIASSWLATTLTGKGYASALVLIFSTIPGILLAPFAGVLADRLERRKLMAFTDAFRAVVLLSIPLLYWLGKLEAWHLYAMGFLVSVGDALYQPTRSGLVREIVPKDRLLEANTTSMTGIQLGMILGAGSSGVVLATFAPPVVMLINAVSFVISGILILRIRSHRVPKTDLARVTFFEDLRLGWAYIRGHPGLLFPYTVTLALSSTAQIMNALLVPFVRNVLKLPASALGPIDAAWAVGAVIAGLMMAGLTRRFSRSQLMVAGPAFLSLSIMFNSQANGLWMAVLGDGLMGFFTRTNVLYRTTVQERTKLEFQGRVESTFGILTSLTFLGLYSAMGAAQESVSPRVLIFAFGVFMALVSVWAWWSLFVRVRGVAQPAD